MLGDLKAILSEKSFVLYTRPYELNIVGLRGNSTVPNRFDDQIHVFYKTGPVAWNYHVYNATTDPGTYWLKNPMMQKGTAILEQGQYLNCYALGMHRGEYNALVQVGPVVVIRDYDRDAVLDFFNGSRDKGYHGINIHRASVNGTTKYVDKYSAGCQVFENASDFNQFIRLCGEHSTRYGNRFTYTLLDFRSVQRQKLKRIAVGSLFAASGLTAYIYLS
ncbi:MAG TPA: hypothetical protein VD905_19675 [Flavobacteriales bacterium]|nr:hypothetical protein [Flavobacteriales bacterium]